LTRLGAGARRLKRRARSQTKLTNPESKRIMLGIALCYVQLAQQAEARDRHKRSD
jgi:hypothetical protein